MTVVKSKYVLPSQTIHTFSQTGVLKAEDGFDSSAVQPASLDLRLGKKAWRVAASFLPGFGGRALMQTVDDLKMHEIDLSADGAVFEKGCVYIVKLAERVNLPAHVGGRANPKSSTGRLDIFTRLIADGCAGFDDLSQGFSGDLYAEISPRTFSVKLRTGDKLLQLRFWEERETAVPDDIPNDTPFTVDVTGELTQDLTFNADFPPIIGWRARKHAGLIDVAKINHYDVTDFWEPVFARGGGGVILDPEDFYILATKEPLYVPPDAAAEMTAYDASFGEFRVHYAGFFDPGFGCPQEGGEKSRGVLEVRTRETPFLILPDQPVGKLVFSPLSETPEILYGSALRSNYQGQRLRLAKQFKYP